MLLRLFSEPEIPVYDNITDIYMYMYIYIYIYICIYNICLLFKHILFITYVIKFFKTVNQLETLIVYERFYTAFN